MRFLLTLALCLLAAGCSTAAFPERPAVSFYVNPTPMVVPDLHSPRKVIGQRALMPPPVPADICVTTEDHLKIEAYFDAIDAQRKGAR